MNYRVSCVAGFAITLMVHSSAAFAQNNVDRQLFLENRQTQAMISQLALAVNQLAEQLKRTDGKVDEQAAALLKGFLEQKTQIDSLATNQKTLIEREGESGLKVLQLEQEVKEIRKGLAMQQTALNEILTALQQPGGVPLPDPTGAQPPSTPPTTTPRAGGNIPPSPSAYYAAGFQYVILGKYEDAISMLTEAIGKFPEWPDAARAQVEIGAAHEQLGHEKEALAAYTLVTQTYKDRDVVPDAYLKLGLYYERLNQKENAKKSLDPILKDYPTSSAATFATQALKRMGFIK